MQGFAFNGGSNAFGTNPPSKNSTFGNVASPKGGPTPGVATGSSTSAFSFAPAPTNPPGGLNFAGAGNTTGGGLNFGGNIMTSSGFAGAASNISGGFGCMGGNTPKKKQAFLSTIPIGRFSTPQDMGNAACFLCSDESSMIRFSFVFRKE